MRHYRRKGFAIAANQVGFLPKGLTPSVEGRPNVSRRCATDPFPRSWRFNNIALMPLVSRRRFSSPRWLARSAPSWKIGRFRWVCRPEALALDRASALRPPLLPSVLPASAQGFHVGRAEPHRGRRLPFLLHGFSEFFAQRQRDLGRCFFLSSVISLRLQPQPGGFFVGFAARGAC